MSNASVLLVPPIQGGSGGWCLALGTPNGCGSLGIPGSSIVAEDWSGSGWWFVGEGGSSSSSFRIQGYAITLPQVAAVSIEGGTPVPTRAETGVPNGLRAVAVEYALPGESGRTTALPSGFTPLDVSGQPIPQPPARQTDTLGVETSPSRHWQRPTAEAHGACQLTAPGLSNVKVEWGTVVTHLHGYADPIGRPYLSCISKEFFLGTWPLLAAVLLDGAHPGATPAPLPRMSPLAGHRGIYDAYSADGEIQARRIPHAWLVVEGGKNLKQRLALLAHLRATIRHLHG